MINALQVACEINALLPAAQRPEHTEGYEGFYHLVGLEGTVERASLEYIIRDHSHKKFKAKKRYLADAVALLGEKYGEGVIRLTLKDQYYNMREKIEPYPEVIEKAMEAMRQARRRADRASDPRRHGRGEAIVHGPAVPEPVYRRHEFPRQIRVLFGRHDATSRANHYKPGPYLVRILTDAQPFVCRN